MRASSTLGTRVGLRRGRLERSLAQAPETSSAADASRRRTRQWCAVEGVHKGVAWLFVALGGLLIAAKETWELREHYEWPVALFWPIAVFMVLVCLSNTALAITRSQQELDRSQLVFRHPTP